MFTCALQILLTLPQTLAGKFVSYLHGPSKSKALNHDELESHRYTYKKPSAEKATPLSALDTKKK